MIEYIRRQFKTGGAKLVLWLTIMSLFIGSFGVFFSFSKRFRADSIGMVNDQSIGALEFRRRYQEVIYLMQQARQMYGRNADALLRQWGLDKDPQQFVMESLINEK